MTRYGHGLGQPLLKSHATVFNTGPTCPKTIEEQQLHVTLAGSFRRRVGVQ